MACILMLQSNCGDLSDTPAAAALKSHRAFLTGNLATTADKSLRQRKSNGRSGWEITTAGEKKSQACATEADVKLKYEWTEWRHFYIPPLAK